MRLSLARNARMTKSGPFFLVSFFHTTLYLPYFSAHLHWRLNKKNFSPKFSPNLTWTTKSGTVFAPYCAPRSCSHSSLPSLGSEQEQLLNELVSTNKPHLFDQTHIHTQPHEPHPHHHFGLKDPSIVINESGTIAMQDDETIGSEPPKKKLKVEDSSASRSPDFA
jgi:hypothetical protein